MWIFYTSEGVFHRAVSYADFSFELFPWEFGGDLFRPDFSRARFFENEEIGTLILHEQNMGRLKCGAIMEVSILLRIMGLGGEASKPMRGLSGGFK